MSFATTQEIKHIALSKIITNQINPRKSFPSQSLEELAQSIKAQGVLQPIIVRHRGVIEGAPYEIICGERRYKATSTKRDPQRPLRETPRAYYGDATLH